MREGMGGRALSLGWDPDEPADMVFMAASTPLVKRLTCSTGKLFTLEPMGISPCQQRQVPMEPQMRSQQVQP